MNESRAWLVQAQSDFNIGSKLGGQNLAHCHPIAKYQQAVEKAVKGLVVAFSEAGILSISIGRRHEAEPYVSAMVRIRRRSVRSSVHHAIQRLFGADVRAEIRDLDAVAPKWPPPGTAPTRNTEYPYQDSKHRWHAPAELDAFEPAEADRFRELAATIVDGCSRIVSALERGPR